MFDNIKLGEFIWTAVAPGVRKGEHGFRVKAGFFLSVRGKPALRVAADVEHCESRPAQLSQLQGVAAVGINCWYAFWNTPLGGFALNGVRRK